MNGSSVAIDIRKVSGDTHQDSEDCVAVEEPLEIQLCSSGPEGAAAKSISITMRTPGNDAELALGFLSTEGIISSIDQVESVDHTGAVAADGRRNTIRVTVYQDVDVDYERLQRHFYTTSSCGVCGKASLDALKISGATALAGVATTFRRELVIAMPDRLREQQHLFSATGGLHAAAAFDSRGEIVVLREDVGRDNAVD
jgi:FdhD protein